MLHVQAMVEESHGVLSSTMLQAVTAGAATALVKHQNGSLSRKWRIRTTEM